MAISKEVWEHIKADYEFGVVAKEQAFSHLAKTYNVNRTTVSKKAKKEEWIYGSKSQIPIQEALCIKGLSEIKEKKSHLNHTELETSEIKKQMELKRLDFNNTNMDIILAMQNKIVEAFDHIDIANLKPKEITSALKDLNDMANPKEPLVNINNANNQQTNNDITITRINPN